eukprot:767418-Hanusia_phi.AAC.3
MDITEQNMLEMMNRQQQSMRVVYLHGRTLISVSDFLIALGVYTTRQQAKERLHYFFGLPENSDLAALCNKEKLAQRGHGTWVADWDTLLDVLSRLRGRVSDAFRAQMRHVYTRVRAGDQTMHAEINRNAASDGIGNVLARDALGMEQGRVLCGQELVDYEQAQSKIRMIKAMEAYTLPLDEKYAEKKHEADMKILQSTTRLAQQRLNTDAVEDKARRMHAEALQAEAKLKKLEVKVKETELKVQKKNLTVQEMRVKEEIKELHAEGIPVPRAKRARKDSGEPKRPRGRPRKVPLAVPEAVPSATSEQVPEEASYSSVLQETAGVKEPGRQAPRRANVFYSPWQPAA